jgi:hypothetical protein
MLMIEMIPIVLMKFLILKLEESVKKTNLNLKKFVSHLFITLPSLFSKKKKNDRKKDKFKRVNSSSIQLSSVFDSPQNDLNSLSPTSN